MRSLVVTGDGWLGGANFVHYWLGVLPGAWQVVLDVRMCSGNLAKLESLREQPEPRFTHRGGSIRDTPPGAPLLRGERLHAIAHFAMALRFGHSIHGSDAFTEAYLVRTHSMLKAARKVWLDEKVTSRHPFRRISNRYIGPLGRTIGVMSLIAARLKRRSITPFGALLELSSACDCDRYIAPEKCRAQLGTEAIDNRLLCHCRPQSARRRLLGNEL